ncbi:WSC domain-containing protein [Cordyceps fumosorosea ARSEF 2679]|uniref:WSC domain-containing protein n=1 Tax=Cordyceps fumosorosea (strain ARSEF 2679) TaxID=1081104 RepID=A0A162MCK8_CORFA|nr:WSC domain-containing protein [Cordyceps fumosorosea ARSEF 2679]OAA54230.1 WSC domain-containing protein [Cordyceps fumosorosea ARSEF 2679]
MKSTFAVAMAAVGAFANTHAELHHVRAPMPAEPEMPRSGSFTLQGCFSSVGNMTKEKVDTTFLSSGKCGNACKAKNQPVAAIAPQDCYCGFVYPPKDSSIGSGDCNYPCNGFPSEMCGGLKNAYSVYNLGINLAPDNYVDPSSSSSSSSATASSTAAASSSSHSATQSPNAETGKPEKSSGGGPNTAAIAAGVVVGVVVAAGIVGAILFFIRRKRNAEIEEDHRRNANLNAFISGSKPPSTSGGISITDSRLDPVMAHRRLSDGSIADNQDYSRKILRVTNA